MSLQGPNDVGQSAGQPWEVVPGSNVYGSDGEKIGVVDMIQPNYLTVAGGFSFATARYIPASAIAYVDPNAVYLKVTSTEIAGQPWEVVPDDEGAPAREQQLAPEQRVDQDAADLTGAPDSATDDQVLELREEHLVARKERRQVGEIGVRVEVDELPGRLAVDAMREEVEIEHVPIGQMVTERRPPWEEDDVLVVPVYEEQLVVVKRLMLREQLRIRRVGVTERQLFEDTLRRERLVVEDPNQTGLVHEQYATVEDTPAAEAGGTQDTNAEDSSLGTRVKKMFS